MAMKYFQLRENKTAFSLEKTDSETISWFYDALPHCFVDDTQTEMTQHRKMDINIICNHVMAVRVMIREVRHGIQLSSASQLVLSVYQELLFIIIIICKKPTNFG